MIEGLNEGRIKVRLPRELQDKLLSLASLWGITADQAVRELISREVLPGRGLATPRVEACVCSVWPTVGAKSQCICCGMSCSAPHSHPCYCNSQKIHDFEPLSDRPQASQDAPRSDDLPQPPPGKHGTLIRG